MESGFGTSTILGWCIYIYIPTRSGGGSGGVEIGKAVTRSSTRSINLLSAVVHRAPSKLCSCSVLLGACMHDLISLGDLKSARARG